MASPPSWSAASCSGRAPRPARTSTASRPPALVGRPAGRSPSTARSATRTSPTTAATTPYRQPCGAVPAGTEVTLRLRAAAGDLTRPRCGVWDALAESQVLVPMEVVARDATSGEHGYDWWEATLPTTDIPTRPLLPLHRPRRRDDPLRGGRRAPRRRRGGRASLADSPRPIVAARDLRSRLRDPGLGGGAVVYQVFPDRFANGDPSNDPSPDAEPGDDGAARYRHGDVYGNDVLARDWETDLPEGACRAYTAPAEPCDEEPLGRDFYGGDLAGIREQLPDLARAGRDGPLPQPGLRGTVEPPLRHDRLHRHRPRPRHRGGPRGAHRGGRGARHPRPPRRGLQPRPVRLAVLRPDRPLRRGRGVRVGRLAVRDLVHVPSPGRAGEVLRSTAHDTTTSTGSASTRSPSWPRTPRRSARSSARTASPRAGSTAGTGGWRLDVMDEISHDFLRGRAAA